MIHRDQENLGTVKKLGRRSAEWWSVEQEFLLVQA
jgi:hypothetical protein